MQDQLYRGTIGFRLMEERQRLGLSQEQFAALVGMSKRVQLKWEKNNSYPDALILATFALNDVDVLYVLTGSRAETPEQHGFCVSGIVGNPPQPFSITIRPEI